MLPYTHSLEFSYLSAGRVAQSSHFADTETETEPRTEARFTNKSLSRNKRLNTEGKSLRPQMWKSNSGDLDFLCRLLLLVVWMNLPEGSSLFPEDDVHSTWVLKSHRLGFKSCYCQPKPINLISLSLTFIVFKMGTLTSICLRLLWGLNRNTCKELNIMLKIICAY